MQRILLSHTDMVTYCLVPSLRGMVGQLMRASLSCSADIFKDVLERNVRVVLSWPVP